MATSNKRICSSCKVNKCNPNFKWCQECYTKSKMGYTYSSCRKCGKPPNPGFELCENCFQSGVGMPTGEKICIMCSQFFYETDKDVCKSCIAKLESGDKSPLAGTPPMCTDCKKNPANPGYLQCEYCYRQTISFSMNGLPPSKQYGTTYNSTVPTISPMCKECKKNPANPGFSRCEYCYRQKLSSPYNGQPSPTQYGTSYSSTIQQYPHHLNPIPSSRFINPIDTMGPNIYRFSPS